MMPRLSSTDRKFWRQAIVGLRSVVPISVPVFVRTREISVSTDGYTEELLAGYRITISNRLGYESRIEALIHEYAHVLHQERRDKRFRLKSWEEQHNDEWGACYSEVYRSWFLWRDAKYGV